MTWKTQLRERFPVLTVISSFVACALAINNVKGSGVCGAFVLADNILSLIIYIKAARMYRYGDTNTLTYQTMAHGVVWFTAYQCGLACEQMLGATILGLIAFFMFWVEWNERTQTALVIQDSSMNGVTIT